jgi:ABC-type transporter Mla MlaB component
MVELISEQTEIATEGAAPATQPNRILRSSRFKYYIHDAMDACRFQLIGELTEFDVVELSGCWHTAKTTLGKRRLILDLRRLKSLDEAGMKWVTHMGSQGAEYVGAPSDSAPVENTAKPGRFGKLLAILRGFRVASTESST